jgi:hypothetical protein
MRLLYFGFAERLCSSSCLADDMAAVLVFALKFRLLNYLYSIDLTLKKLAKTIQKITGY